MLTHITAHHILLQGTPSDIGAALGRMVLAVPGLAGFAKLPLGALPQEDFAAIHRLLEEYCPGLNEELATFAETLRVPPERAMYYAWTYLKPGCSQMAALPSLTEDGHVLMARNYDYSHKMDDMTLYTTRVTGKYAHLGFGMIFFGRSEGMNEHGLGVSQTSAGLPVTSAANALRRPKVSGLQFWAVIRTILENCRNVEEALDLVREMPIAYNINLLLADKAGNAALLETLDGRNAVKHIGPGTPEQFLCTANHVILPELAPLDPKRMQNSLVRQQVMEQTLQRKPVSRQDLKNLLTAGYPEGLCNHYYNEFFGTLRGLVFDLSAGTAEVCFGSPDLNPWQTFTVDGPVQQDSYPVKLKKEKSIANFFQMV